MTIGFDDRARAHEEMSDLFNNLHQDRHPIIRFVVAKTLRIFNLIGNVINLPKSGQPKIGTNELICQDIAVALHEFPKISITFLVLNYDVSCRSVARILNKKTQSYKPQSK